MNKLLLSKYELKELTGWEDVKRQLQWLSTHGYSYDIGGDGYPKVLRQHVINKLSGGLTGNEVAFAKQQAPNFAALGR